MSIQLKVGKSYRNRLGEVVKIVARDNDSDYSHKCNNGRWYTTAGAYYYDQPDEWDLIEELVTEGTHNSEKQVISEKEQFKFELDDVISRDGFSYIVVGRCKDVDTGKLHYILDCLPDEICVLTTKQVHEQFKIVS